MLKNILKLDGAQQLSKNEQKEINGGIGEKCHPTINPCVGVPPPGTIIVCVGGRCQLELLPD